MEYLSRIVTEMFGLVGVMCWMRMPVFPYCIVRKIYSVYLIYIYVLLTISRFIHMQKYDFLIFAIHATKCLCRFSSVNLT